MKKLPFIICFLLLVLIVMFSFNWISNFLFTNPIDSTFPKFELVKLIIQILGGIAILFGLYFSFKQFKLSEQSIQQGISNINLSLQSLNYDKYKNAIENLGSDKPEMRIASYYSLMSLVEKDVAERENVLNILSMCIRRNTLNDKIDSYELQVLMHVMYRNNNYTLFKDNNLIVDNAKMYELNLTGFQLSFASLHKTELIGIYFCYAKLNGAFFTEAKIEKLNFEYSDLTGAFFDYSIIENSNFSFAKLNACSFSDAVLINCNFYGATGLSEVIFSRAKEIRNCRGIDNKKIDTATSLTTEP